jgi:hypothetical protein
MRNTMKPSSKIIVALLVTPLILATLGQLSTACSEPLSPPDKALAYIKNVLSIDMERYTIMNMSYYELPEPPNSTYRTEAVTYILNSSESMLAVNCMFRNGVQYTCDLRVLSGSPKSDRSYANLVDVAERILEKHQVQTGVDSKELIKMLNMVDPTKNLDNVTLDNVTLIISHGKLPTGGLKMINGSLHIDSTTMSDITSFDWMRPIEGTDATFLLIDFENGVFHSLRDERAIFGIGSNTESFPTTTVAAASASIAVFGVGLTIYLKKRDHPTKTSINCESAVA